MHPFRPRFRAEMTCRTAFGALGWLNIDFATGPEGDIPFHVSLRRDEGLAVVNRRHAGAWGREVRWPFAFGPGPVAVRVAFGLGRVGLWLDGRLMGRFDALPRPDPTGRYGLRLGFPGLGRIAGVRLNGAVAPGSLRLAGTGLARPQGLVLTDRLELVWHDPPEGAEAMLSGDGLDPPEPAAWIEGPQVDRAGRAWRSLVAPLPGRVWAGGAARIAAGFAGGPSLALDRAGLIARLTAAAGTTLWARDPVAALQAVEHARHARLLPDLPEAARAALIAAARRAGLDGWLTEGAGLPLPPPPAPDPVQARMDDLRARTGSALRAGNLDAALTLTRTALTDRDAPPSERQALARALTEGFIHAGRMDDLAALAQDAGLLPLAEGPSAWHLSTAMPFDLAQGWFGAVADRLAALAARPPGWTVTPAVGWAVARLAALAPGGQGRHPGPDAHRRAIAAFLDWLDPMAGDYDSRAPCRALIAAGVAILARPDLLPADLAHRSAWVATRVWGLSPAFWAALGPDVPPLLRPAATVAAAIFDHGARARPDRAALDALLLQAQTLGMADAGRFRRELLGPVGLPDGPPDPAALAARGVEPGEACFRALSHPLSDGAPPAAVAAAIDHLRHAWPEAPDARDAALAATLVADARALLAAPDAAALGDWAARARLLDRATGLALALGLAAGLARQGQGAGAAALLAPLAATPPDPLPEPAALAAAVLARHAPDLATPFGAPAPDARGMGPDTLFDTLVCVYSCAPNLATRLPHLRATWLADLDAAGIPWLVFTGGGDGTAEGRVVRLDAPDDYEGLPDKTLAMVRWVLANTGASRILKVDDDCFVHVPALFGDAALLAHPWLGRPLTRAPGQTDRTWHMAKSASARGRLTPDKSPEPSRYADGGTGYVLSRGAMAALIAAADSPEGRRLHQVSVMEDKLVGDLMALAGVPLSGEGWRTAVWRRPAPGLPPAPAWEVGPMPFDGAPVRLAHLDDPAAIPAAAQAARAPAPPRGRIWPTFLPARCGSRTNALDLVSPPERLAAAAAAPVAVVAAVRNEAAILPLFLDHYRRLGVTAFLIADNASSDATGAILRDAPDVAAFSVETPYADSLYGVAWQQAMVANFRVGRWSLVADADEFLVLPDDAPDLPALLAAPAMAGFDAVRIKMLDLYPRGPLSGVTLASGDPFAETGWADRAPFLRETPVRGPFSDGETLTSALRHRLIPGQRSELFTAQKVALLRYRPWMRLTAGLHHVGEVRLAPRDLTFAHFKYTAAFRAKAEAEVRRRQHFNDAEEYRAYLALMAEGRETIWDEAVSVPWRAALDE